MDKADKQFRVAVIGAGISGVAAVVKLRAAGIEDVVVFEKADRVGGTWRDNVYPGLACDVPSHLYRFSFAPNPNWSRRYAPQPEILEYIESVSEQFDVLENVRFGHVVTRVEWIDGKWRITTNHGDQGDFDAVISAVGVLHYPVLPDIAGGDSFKGASFHTARWDRSVRIDGKRVGIIGTGATAAQIVSATVDRVDTLTVFQRTPQWILPEPNLTIAEAKKEAFKADPSLMQTLYDQLAVAFNGRYGAAIVGGNPEVYEETKAACEDYLATVKDPELRAKLTPDYKMGCKRLIVSDQFYGAIQKPNVNLVTEPIAEIVPEGVRMADGTVHELDILVYATGFNPHNPFAETDIIGVGGNRLQDEWKDGNYAYRSVSIPDFPNFFMVGGPNAPIGNFSFIMTCEKTLSYIIKLIDHVRQGKAKAIAPKRDETEQYYRDLRVQMSKTVWAAGCNSWYIDKNGRVATFPWTYDVFESFMDNPEYGHFEAVEAEHAAA